MTEKNHILNFASELPRAIKNSIAVAADSIAISLSMIAAMVVRLETTHFVTDPAFLATLLLTIASTLFGFFAVGLYNSVVRFITGKIVFTISLGAGISATFVSALRYFDVVPLPSSIPILTAIFTILTVGAIRFSARHLFRRHVNRVRKPVLIFGAGGAGLQLLNTLFHGAEYAPVAFIDDNPNLYSLQISGLNVYSPSDIPKLVADRGVEMLLLAAPGMTRMRKRKLIEDIEGLPLLLRIIPAMSEIISGEARISELRPISPEDVLGRDPIPPITDLMTARVKEKTVLISGAGGSIGSELCRQIVTFKPSTLVLLDISEFAMYSIEMELKERLEKMGSDIEIVCFLGSVQDVALLNLLFKQYCVHTIFHAAAYKHVPIIESNIIAGVKNNVIGTWNFATAAMQANVEAFILISTDKAVRPTNIMGATKRLAELTCQALAEKSNSTVFSMVRFGNVLGSSGSVIPRFRSQIEAGGPVTVTHRDITRYFMTIPEAAQLVIQAGSMAEGGEVFVLDMGQPLKILDLATNMIRLSGLKPVDEEVLDGSGDIEIKITGLRPGEKLYEELLIGASSEFTAHERILKANEESLTMETIHDAMGKLELHCREGDKNQVVKILQALPLMLSRPEDSAAGPMSAVTRD